MALPAITFTGRLTADPELRFTNNGKEFITLRAACNDRRKSESGEWIDGDTAFMSVISWRNTDSIRTLLKGDQVTVVGVLKQRDYETKDGERRSAYEVQAEHVSKTLTDKVTPRESTSTGWGSTESAPVWDDSEAPF